MDARALRIVAPVVLLAAAATVAAVLGRRAGVNDPGGEDPVLARLRARNPRLEISRGEEERANRIPAYWVKDPADGGRILLPARYAEGEGAALVQVTRCDPFEVPARLRYPRASEPVCLTIESEDGRLEALSFRTADALADLVAHYDGAARKRPGRYLESTRYEEPAGGPRRFLHAYALYERAEGGRETSALVVYRITRPPER